MSAEHIMTKCILRKLNLLFIALLCVSTVRWYDPGAVRAAESPWSDPLNLSSSGAASQPVMAASPDGTLHVMWWDAVSGELYLRIGVTDTQRGQPVVVSEIYGERTVTVDTRSQQATIAQTQPREIRLMTDQAGSTLCALV